MLPQIVCKFPLPLPRFTFFYTVEPPASDHPKCKDLVVAYKNRTAQGALPRRSPGHIYFMQDNLLHTISKLSHEYF